MYSSTNERGSYKDVTNREHQKNTSYTIIGNHDKIIAMNGLLLIGYSFLILRNL
ncbi:hypothetical protein bsdtb5_40150 [Anaeromicropila herbilytica]|uniref:Uncharacterized protein n=2 Tax=Anaeromicropila herbilytica TaxID=2785025 RepID=A0A7R7EQ70_9FIRM|nr:hypothetical protein bsdtb5_40150 [Anaeromicropila herbilytica]